MPTHNSRYSAAADAILPRKRRLAHVSGSIGYTNGKYVGLSQPGIPTSLATWPTFRVGAVAMSLTVRVSLLRDHIAGVVELGAQEEMLVTHARRIVAGMENIEAIGDRAMFQRPGEAMGPPVFSTHRDNTVALDVDCTCPNQAFARWDKLRMEPFGDVWLAVLVPTEKTHRLAFDIAAISPSLAGQLRLTATAAVTVAKGGARIGEHDRPPFDCAASPAVNSSAGTPA